VGSAWEWHWTFWYISDAERPFRWSNQFNP
jgi:hypothetical protein